MTFNELKARVIAIAEFSANDSTVGHGPTYQKLRRIQLDLKNAADAAPADGPPPETFGEFLIGSIPSGFTVTIHNRNDP